MEWLTRLMMPPQGSAFAGEVDTVYMALFWLSVVLFLGIAIPALYFAWRYRYKPGRVTPHSTHNTTLEIVWSVLPLLLCVGIFFWGLERLDGIFGGAGRGHGNPDHGQASGLWRSSIRTARARGQRLHVPVNKPVQFVMTSEDVIHDFFVPDMRVKHDIIPGRYTEVWFTPTVLGKHMVTCAEYCGKGHSDMQATADRGKRRGFPELSGHRRHGVGRLQDPHGRLGQDPVGAQGLQQLPYDRRNQKQGPHLEGHLGHNGENERRQVVLVDEAYIRESMNLPQAKIVEGFEPIMPTFQGLIKPQEIRRHRRVDKVATVGSLAGQGSDWNTKYSHMGAQDRQTCPGPRRIISTRPRAFWSWAGTLDHKRIGVMYLVGVLTRVPDGRHASHC